MATVRKIERKNGDGTTTSRYLVRGIQNGTPFSRKFRTRAAADSFCAKTNYRLEMGLPAEGKDVGTVLDIGQAWCDHFEDLVKAGKREHTTWAGYDQHKRLHIGTHPIAGKDMRELTPPDCQAFATHLELTRSSEMARKVFTSFCTMLDYAVSKGWLAVNPATTIKIDTADRRLLGDIEGDEQDRAVIPELPVVRRVIDAARGMCEADHGRALALACLVTFQGLRISEVRGLALKHLQLFGDDPKIRIRQRADARGNLGPPKSRAGYRSIALGPLSVTALRAWVDYLTKQGLAGGDRLVFPTDSKRPYSYSHLYRHVLVPMLARARLVTHKPKVDNAGKPTVRDGGHFAGPYCPLVMHPSISFHDFRHVAASTRIADGADPKTIQQMMGHSKVSTTMDIYGHLWVNKQVDANTARATEALVLNAKEQ